MRRFWNLLAISFVTSTVWAASVLVTDGFHVPGSSDVIGDKLQFDAQSIRVSSSSGVLTVDVFTNFNNAQLNRFRLPGMYLDVGDLLFTVNGAYTYGIPLHYHNSPSGGPFGERLLAGHIYQIED